MSVAKCINFNEGYMNVLDSESAAISVEFMSITLKTPGKLSFRGWYAVTWYWLQSYWTHPVLLGAIY